MAAKKPTTQKTAGTSNPTPAVKKTSADKSAPKKTPSKAPKASATPVTEAAAATKSTPKKSKKTAAETPVLAPKQTVSEPASAPKEATKPVSYPKPEPVIDIHETIAPAPGVCHAPAFILKQKQRLLDLRDELVDAMSGMTRDTIRNAPEGSEASGSGQHTGDAGSDAYDRDFALSVLAKEQDALYEIEQALRRIQLGTYGICEISGKKIPTLRLEAIPFARLTVECQTQWEKEYGKRRFRPSNEVGFGGGNYSDDEDSDTVSLDDDED
jgi:DnaK suppressor protein